nr:MAG TPA: protein of unknown function (DUF4564) [Caudoviricetes sp.]
MMRFSNRTSTVGYILAFIVGGLLAEDNLNSVSASTLWWFFGIGALWLYLVFSDIKCRIDRLEKENRQYKEVYHV